MWCGEDEDIAHLSTLLEYFVKHTFRATNTGAEHILERCLKLYGKDYKYSILDNEEGCLCSHYPSKIILPSFLGDDEESRQNWRDLFGRSRIARCRSRFVVPVLQLGNKNICRSATLASATELYGRSGYDFLLSAGNYSMFKRERRNDESADLFNEARGSDVRLLKEMSVKYIVDLMVERKKVKFGLNVTSSEKVDKENRYCDFDISSMPYPGCEFFRDFKNNCYCAEGIYFDWNQTFVDAHLTIPSLVPGHINWTQYKSWDLVTLTKNYLLFILQLLKDGDGSILIHCISGWDRTPLFLSLIRLSLWADGKAHDSLSASEILYFTIAYDWFLFGHDLKDRMMKDEQIFYFCFHFLKYIVSEEFSINTKDSELRSQTERANESQSESSVPNEFCDCLEVPVRQQKLEAVSSLFYSVYESSIGKNDKNQNQNTGIFNQVATKMMKVAAYF